MKICRRVKLSETKPNLAPMLHVNNSSSKQFKNDKIRVNSAVFSIKTAEERTENIKGKITGGLT